MIDRAELRRKVEFAEPPIRAAMVSAFARLLEDDPADAKIRLSAVNEEIDLAAQLRGEGDSSPESRFFAAAEATFAHFSLEEINLQRVTFMMLGLDGDEDDVAHIESIVEAGHERFGGRQFETYAGTFYHLRVTRMALDSGAQLGMADPKSLYSALESDHVASTLHSAVYWRHQAEAASTDLRHSADAMLRNYDQRRQRGSTPARMRLDELLYELVQQKIDVVEVGKPQDVAKRAAAAFGGALDSAHVTSPVPRRPDTVHRAAKQPPSRRGRTN